MNVDASEFSTTTTLNDVPEDEPANFTSLQPGTVSSIPQFDRLATGARTVAIIDDKSGLPTGETQLIDEDLATIVVALAANFFYRFALRMQWTILPYYAQKFNASPTQIGTLFAVSNITMVPTTLFIGRFSDKYGRRIALLLAVGGIFFVWSFAALAWDYWSLLVARVLVGFCMGSTALVVAIIKDMFDDTKIPQYIGYATLLGAIAKILGPPIASGMSQFSLRAPLWASGSLNLVGTLLVYFFLRETNQAVIDAAIKKELAEEEFADFEKEKKDNKPLPAYVEGEKDIGIEIDGKLNRQQSNIDGVSEPSIFTWQIYFIYFGFFICGFASALTLSMLALYLTKEYNTSSVTYGFYLLGLELVSTLFLTFGYPFMVYTMGVYSTLICVLVLNGLGYLIIALDEWSVWVAVIGAGIAVLGQNVLRPSLQVMLSYAIVDKSKAGNIFALSMASLSGGMVVSPLVSGPLFSMSPKLPFWLGAIVMVFTAVAVQVARCFGLEHDDTVEEEDMTDEEIAAQTGKSVPLSAQSTVRPALADLTKLGTWFGTLLFERDYNWVPNYEQLQSTLQRMFPVKATQRQSRAVPLMKKPTLMAQYSRDVTLWRQPTGAARTTIVGGGLDMRMTRRTNGTIADLAEYHFDPNVALQANSAAVLQ